MRKGFTLIELIFVVAILSVIGMFGISQITNIYETYLIQKINDELETEAKIVLEQITKRISEGIPESICLFNGDYSCNKSLSSANGDQSNIIGWIGASSELQNGLLSGANNLSGLSGFVDLNVSLTNQISTPASNFANADIIINRLAQQTIGIGALYFGLASNNSCDGFFNNNSPLMSGISGYAPNYLTLSNVPPSISQYYKASFSAYAVEYNATDGTLWLRYNMRPWLSQSINQGQISMLAKNISGFGVKNESGLVRINICMSNKINGTTTEICKERAIY